MGKVEDNKKLKMNDCSADSCCLWEKMRNVEQFQVQKTPLAGTSCQGCCCIVIRQ